MTVDKNENNRRLRSRVALTGACAALAWGTADAATYIEPRIGFDLTWTDNVTLAPPGVDERDEMIAELRPGITFTHDGQNLQAFFDYTLQAVYFQQESDSQVFHQGDLGVQYAVVPEWFYFDVGGSRNQTVIDPRQPINAGNMFQTGNLADSTSAQITPILLHRFRFVELEASYTRGFLNYSQADTIAQTPTTTGDFDDSTNSSAVFSLRSADREARVSWSTNYRHDRVNYDIAEPFEYDQLYGEVGFLINRGWRLIGQAGVETDPIQHRTDGGLDERSYKGGFEYHEGERNVLRMLVGHRFFGRTYEGLWRYTGRVLESSVTYDEGPTTQTQNRVIRGVTAPTTDFPPGLDNNEFSRTTSDVYVSKTLEGRVGVQGRITGIFLTGNYERRQYLYLGNIEDKYTGASLLVTRRLGPRVTLEGTVSYTDTELREGGKYNDRGYTLSLTRQIGNKTQLTLTGNRIERTGATQPYTANWVLLGIEVNFAGADRPAAGGVGGRGFPGGRPATRANTLPTIPQR